MAQTNEEDKLYLPLATDDTIRLLDFRLSGSSHVAKLIHVKLSEAPSYIALSYVWGKTGEWEVFEIDGWDVPVTPNLFAFFYYLVDDARPQQAVGLDAADGSSHVYLWIDALCINQDDLQERSQQVRLMKQIYERASKVLVWLGPLRSDNGTDQMALEQLFAAWTWFTRITKSTGSVQGIYELQQKPLTSEEDLMGVEELLSSERWAALGNFIVRREWWQRMWTVQESATEVKKEYMCANIIIFAEAFGIAELLYQWMRSSGKIAIPLEADRGFDFIGGRGRSERMGSAGGRLYELLVLLSRNEATDPRDKVYAALGLTNETEARGVTIDYTLQTSTVYLQTARQILSTASNLDWLASASNPLLGDLPSWVPDWTSDRFGLGLFKTDDNNSTLYHASGHVNPQALFFAPKEADGRLNIKGTYADRISSIATGNTLEDLAATPWLNEMLTSLGRKYEATGQIFYEALHRTFLMDCVWNANGTPISRGLKFAGVDPEQYFKGKPLLDILTAMTRGPTPEDIGHHLDMKAILTGRRLAVTQGGYLAVVPATSAVGDHIVTLIGSSVPHVLRPALDVEQTEGNTLNLFLLKEQDPRDDETANICIHIFLEEGGIETLHHSANEKCLICTDETCQYYRLIGEAYVHGLMDGEVLGLPHTGGVRHVVLV